jgi:cytoskeletal protein CcmA (bactofilin family)
MNIRKILLILTLIILPVVVLAGRASSQSFRTGDNVTVAKDQTENGALWTSGRNVDIAGTVNGDVFCASQDVIISGTINGDVICAAQTIHISGTVNGDVRLAAQTVTLSSEVTGSASVAVQSFTLNQNGSVGRDAGVAASDVAINGTVGRDLLVSASRVEVTNKVGRNVQANVEVLRLSSRAQVGGNVSYTSEKPADIAKGAAIAGTTSRNQPGKAEHRGPGRFYFLFKVYTIVSLLVLALVLILVAPRLFYRVSDVAIQKPLRTLLVGVVAGLAFPVLFIALLFTVVGIPLALLLLAVWMPLLAFAGLAFSFYIGRLVLRNQTNAILAMVAGTLIVLVALMIPFIGTLVFLACIWMGLGMVLTELWRRFERPDYTIPRS